MGPEPPEAPAPFSSRTRAARAGHRLAGSSDTEQQRQAMVHYRALFDELLEDSADRALERDDTGTTQEVARS